MTVKGLLNSFDEWRKQEQGLVLATVYETAGSTYSKAGARMLINSEGDFQGMLSGGCLEGDLAERARQVLDSGTAQRVTYDLGLNSEELWGLGVGCDGLMKIFLQPLQAENDYAPFRAMLKTYEGDHCEIAVTVLESDSDEIEAGATLLTAGDKAETFGLSDAAATILLIEANAALARMASSTSVVQIGEAKADILLALIKPRPRLLVLGAGLDAEPVTRLAAELGWRITIVDHRPAYIENGSFDEAEKIVCCPAAELSGHFDLSGFDAAIVMSHHLETDKTYLAELALTDIRYIGLLGPGDRRKRLLADLGDASAAIEGRLHGPAGLDIGAVGPAAIALSILAQAYGEIGGN